MKKVGIDARLYFQTGVGVYLRNLLYYLQKAKTNDVVFYIYLMKEDSPKVEFNQANFVKKEVSCRWHSFSEQVDFARLLYRDKLDLMHFTYFSYPIIYRRLFIATIHDTTPLLFKTGRASTKNWLSYEIKHFFFKIVLASQIRHSATVITPTKAVKDQLVKIYGQKYKKKILPISEGVNYELINIDAVPPRLKLNKDFFIYVGNFYPHKNVERLIRAFSQLDKNIQLILVGPDGFFSERLVRLIDQSNQKKKIMFLNNPTNGELIYLYKNALALINPSISEGFGLPLVEAAYFGLPVIASDIAVFHEILDGQYLSFDPQNSSDIATKIEFFLKNKPKFDYRKILEKHSFAKMADKTLSLYQNLLNQ